MTDSHGNVVTYAVAPGTLSGLGLTVPLGTSPGDYTVVGVCTQTYGGYNGYSGSGGIIHFGPATFTVLPVVPQSKDDCKNGGWQGVTDDQGRPFKNQGDCVSFAATGGKNKAKG